MSAWAEEEGMAADASEGHADPGKRASVAEREREIGGGWRDRANCSVEDVKDHLILGFAGPIVFPGKLRNINTSQPSYTY